MDRRLAREEAWRETGGEAAREGSRKATRETRRDGARDAVGEAGRKAVPLKMILVKGPAILVKAGAE